MASNEVKHRVLVARAPSEHFDYDAKVDRLGPLLLMWLAGCATSVPRTVPRVVDGHVEEGALVSPYAYRWFIEGEMEAARGHHDEASLAFESATAAPSGDILLMTRLAEEYEKSGASRRADRTLSVARRFYPSSPYVAIAEARILRQRGQLEDAVLTYERAAWLSPWREEPPIELAEVLVALGREQRAAGVLVEHLEMAPKSRARRVHDALIRLANQLGDPDLLLRALSLGPDSTASRRAELAGRLALREGKPAHAVRILESALDSPGAVNLWLRALVLSGNRERAIEYLRSPESARWIAVEDRADALIELEQGERALELLAASRRSARVRYSMGDALRREADYLGAASALAEVPFGASSHERSRLAFADCALAVARHGAGAEALSTTAHASLPVRKTLADIYLREGDARSALRLFDPRDRADRAALASVFERAGRYDEAAAYYAAVKLEDAATAGLRARVSAERHAARGLRTTAIAILEQRAGAAPEDLYARARLVELLADEGRGADATTRGEALMRLVSDARLRAHVRTILSSAARAPNGD